MKNKKYAVLAQLGEHLAYIQRVGSSNLSVCTRRNGKFSLFSVDKGLMYNKTTEVKFLSKKETSH